MRTAIGIADAEGLAALSMRRVAAELGVATMSLRLEVAARLQWAAHRRHPWTARVVSLTRPLAIPNGMAHTDWAMRAVDGLGLDLPTILHVAVTLAGFVQGIAVNLESEVEAQQETGVTSDEWMQSQEAMLGMITSGRFPMLARLAEYPEVDMDLDTLFEFGLKVILDGLAVLIEKPR